MLTKYLGLSLQPEGEKLGFEHGGSEASPHSVCSLLRDAQSLGSSLLATPTPTTQPPKHTLSQCPLSLEWELGGRGGRPQKERNLEEFTHQKQGER